MDYFLIITLLVACGPSKKAYRANVEETVEQVIETSAKAETLVNQYASVWDYTIKARDPIQVGTMAVIAGITEEDVEAFFSLNTLNQVSDDFSSNIHALQAYYDDAGEIAMLENDLKSIKEQVSELKNPPKEYEEIYRELLDLYNLSDEFIHMAIDPSGSLQDYNASKNDLTNEIISIKKRIEVIMPD